MSVVATRYALGYLRAKDNQATVNLTAVTLILDTIFIKVSSFKIVSPVKRTTSKPTSA
jgi:hypothetical protein